MAAKEPPHFDPFAHRIDRDVRNRLSSAFIEALDSGIPLYRRIADELSAGELRPAARRYLEDRRDRYDRVWRWRQNASGRGVAETLRQLWNDGLFFECHELLEEEWHTATGGERMALQGLILAAGAYVHLELDRKAAGTRLARKAAARLAAYRDRVLRLADPDALIAGLQAAQLPPPRLEAPKGEWRGKGPPLETERETVPRRRAPGD
jgi:hypothetical protein